MSALTSLTAAWQRRPHGLPAFACLYFSFGITLGFLGGGAPIILRERGVALAQIGLLQMIYLPLGLTFLWARLLDTVRLPGLPQRVGWIVAMQALSVALLLALSAGEGWPIGTLFAAACAISFAFATMDIALESLVVETVTADRRPLVTTIKLFGASVGGIVGTGLLTIFFARFGWRTSLVGVAVLNAVCLLPVLRYPEGLLRLASARSTGSAPGAPRRRTLVKHTVVVGFYFAASGLLFNGNSLVLLDLRQSVATVGIVVGTVGPAINLAMTLASGSLMARFSAAQLVAIMACGAAASGLLLILATTIASGRLGVAAVVLGSVAASGLGVPVFNMIYRWAQGAQAATDYALLFGLSFLAAMPARVGGPALAQAMGWPAFFAFATTLYAAAVILLGTAMRRTERADREVWPT